MTKLNIRFINLEQLETTDLREQVHIPPAQIAMFTKATEFLEQGDVDKAVACCLDLLAKLPVTVPLLTHVVILLHNANRPDVAEGCQNILVTRLHAMAQAQPDHVLLNLNVAMVFSMLDCDEDALKYASIAARVAPLNEAAAFLVSALSLSLGDADGAITAWDAIFAAQPQNGLIRLKLARVLAGKGFMDQARQILDLAEPLCRDMLPEYQYLADGIRGTQNAKNQAAMAASIFDGMSQTYDQTLKKLDNRGPRIVGQVLDLLNLPKTGTLHVLDAGCGTGLCAPLLQPLANVLHGCDLSIGMLNEAKKKGCYTLLTRSDLSSIGTLPQGPFDLIVTSDVLVYFGDLAEVFQNFAKITRPGGWLIVTVEDAGDPGPARGWQLDVSGRHKHSLAYLKSALAKAGYTTPKHVVQTVLRREMGAAVAGIGFATQRLSLVL